LIQASTLPQQKGKPEGGKKKMKEEVYGEQRTEYSRQKGEDKLQVQKDQDKKDHPPTYELGINFAG